MEIVGYEEVKRVTVLEQCPTMCTSTVCLCEVGGTSECVWSRLMRIYSLNVMRLGSVARLALAKESNAW